jgi:hypothetical protein
VEEGDVSAAADGTFDILGWNGDTTHSTDVNGGAGAGGNDDDDGHGASLEETSNTTGSSRMYRSAEVSAHTAGRSSDSIDKTPMRSYFAGDGSGQHSAKTVRRRTASLDSA